ncbi:hypothetical protein SteCoe_37198 [Stentor coeruleus]|uniref:Cystatin domain-containing protein n=1 Tax=Stentor coeruleus TaxID=5963 RepID=A0A1R2ANM6_9CILI|nr:hypothetical protein SteCoe_37198 [Stentor coeruleus]
MKAGGFNAAQAATGEVQNIIEQVRNAVADQIGNVGEYRAHSFQRQVVAGTNYKVKVHIFGDQYIHIKVFVPLPYTQQPPQLSTCETGKTESDPIN